MPRTTKPKSEKRVQSAAANIGLCSWRAAAKEGGYLGGGESKEFKKLPKQGTEEHEKIKKRQQELVELWKVTGIPDEFKPKPKPVLVLSDNNLPDVHVVEPDAEPDVKPKPKSKPKPKPRSKKVKVETTDDVNDDDTETKVTEPKPKKRKTVHNTDGGDALEPVSDTQPKPKRKRKRPTKSTATTDMVVEATA